MITHPNRRNGYQRRRITIPDGLAFADLKLARDSDGAVTFDSAAIVSICEASGIDPSTFIESHEDNVAGLIVAWYGEHRAHGGAADPTAEDLIFETKIEGERGSHQPGRA